MVDGTNIVNDIFVSVPSSIYSYMLYAFPRNKYYEFKYMVADNEEFNTINFEEVLPVIKQAISGNHSSENKIILYQQPSLDLFFILYEPMISKMAKRINQDWPQLEYDDLAQICRMCCVELHNKGYYLHKSLIWTTFKNAVLEELRPLKRRGTVISIYESSNDENDKNNKTLRLIDGLVDVDALNTLQDQDYKDAEMAIFAEVKDIIVDFVGQRRFDALFRDYKHKHTTGASRKLLIQIKAHLKSMGITRDDFDKKYH